MGTRKSKRRPKRFLTKRKKRKSSRYDSSQWLHHLIAGAVVFVFSVWVAGSYRKSAEGEFKVNANLSMHEKLDYWSGRLEEMVNKGDQITFLPGAPQIPDSAPLVPSKFDCTTYVETVFALSKSKEKDDYFTNLMKVRYHGSEPTFQNRNHFPELDWIPNNVEAGILTDFTKSLAKQSGADYEKESKDINKFDWVNRQAKRGLVDRSVASSTSPEWKKTQEAEVTYIPIDQLDKVYKYLPDGAVLNLVRKDVSKQDVIISHQGFIFRHGKQVMFRHASASGHVRTSELKSYLKRRAENKEWPVLGINVTVFNAS